MRSSRRDRRRAAVRRGASAHDLAERTWFILVTILVTVLEPILEPILVNVFCRHPCGRWRVAGPAIPIADFAFAVFFSGRPMPWRTGNRAVFRGGAARDGFQVRSFSAVDLEAVRIACRWLSVCETER